MSPLAQRSLTSTHGVSVNQGYEGRPLEAQYLIDLLDVFGEVGVRMYLVGILEGQEDAQEEEAAADPDAVEVIVDYETGEVTHIERTDADEDAPLDDSDSDEEQNPN